MALSGKYSVGQPVQYSSIYSYQKFKFPIMDEAGNRVGWAKQERIVDEVGDESGVCYYTRDLPKPHGAKRFYSSPQALIIACGGEIDRTAPNPLQATMNVQTVLAPNLAKIIAAADAQDGEPDDLQADDLEDNGPASEEDENKDPGPTNASAKSLAEFLAKGPPPQPQDQPPTADEEKAKAAEFADFLTKGPPSPIDMGFDEPDSVEATVKEWAEENGAVATPNLTGSGNPAASELLGKFSPKSAAEKSASAKKGVATRAANKLAADKLVQKEARAAKKLKAAKAAKRVAKKFGQ